LKKLILLLFIPLVSFGQSETENNSKVPSEIIDNVPVYPGCKGSELKKIKCISERRRYAYYLINKNRMLYLEFLKFINHPKRVNTKSYKC